MRTAQVVRLHTANRMQVIGWPLIIMAVTLAFVIAGIALVHATVPAVTNEGLWRGLALNGAIFSLLGPLVGFGFTAMTQYFPLALGLGLTRREFAAGTALVFLGVAALFAAIVTAGKVIEVATGGYGLGARFFDTVITGTGPWWHTALQTFLLIAMMAFVGAAISTAFARWGQSFLWVFWIAAATVALAVTAALLLRPDLRTWVGTVGWGGWMLCIALVGTTAAAAWLLLVRRAQVR